MGNVLTAPSSFQLPRHMQILHDKLQEFELEKKNASAHKQPHQYYCSVLLLVQLLSKMRRYFVHVSRMIGDHITIAARNYRQKGEKPISQPLNIESQKQILLRPTK